MRSGLGRSCAGRLKWTGLRPFCELATITADDIEETPRGTMWRVYSSKTKKTRKIPVRDGEKGTFYFL